MRRLPAALMLVLYLLAVTDFTFVDTQGKTTIRIDANPRLKKDGGPFLSIIRQRNKYAIVAL